MNKKLEALFQEKVQDKVILVTGASSGIGLTISNKLADAGAHVLLGCDAFELAPYSPFIYCDWVCLFSFL